MLKLGLFSDDNVVFLNELFKVISALPFNFKLFKFKLNNNKVKTYN